ncbi:hypothetical protein DENIS_0286 [Desulfonema ishimotonii]|uniref:CHAT domain-containing protein n=1 Tax=Desulfonema ishimotonii TaxID=45657 RepID=A0A401FQV7_9BACT|nr:CHAT domain-containing protein [Desulfonema ishimotonii]GBC59347.1 hypothetical protein DENIS_0286 [Desulfonema ishimotonii]
MKKKTLYLEADRDDDRLKIGLYTTEAVIWRYETLTLPIREIEERCRRVVEEFNAASRKNGHRVSSFRKLESEGGKLAKELLPKGLREKLAASNADYLILKIDDRLVHMPWELIYLDDRFLCQQFCMGRIVKTRQRISEADRRSLGRPLGMWIVADPRGDLASAGDEGEALYCQMEALNKEAGATVVNPVQDADLGVEDIAEQIREYDLVHFAGHVEYDREHPAQSGWKLADGNFTANHIDKLADGPGASALMPALIFANACQSARTEEWDYTEAGDSSFGLSNAFLRAGVRHYIGTFWEIRDASGSDFAKAFYDRLRSGKTVGEAVRESRCHLTRKSQDIAWMSYVLYGDPSVSYFSSKNIVSSSSASSEQLSPVTRGTDGPLPRFPNLRLNEDRLRYLAHFFAVVLMIGVAVTGAGISWGYYDSEREKARIEKSIAEVHQKQIKYQIVRQEREALRAQAEETRQRVEKLWEKLKVLCPELRETSSPTIAVVLGSYGLPEADRRLLLFAVQEQLLYQQKRFNLVERDSFDKVLESLVRNLETTSPEKRVCRLEMPTHLVIIEKFRGNRRPSFPVLMRLVKTGSGRVLVSQFEDLSAEEPVTRQKEKITRNFLKKLETAGQGE